MMLEIPQVLDSATLAAIQSIAEQRDLFAQGQQTAGWRARERKNNLQAHHTDRVVGVLKKIEQAVMQHPVVEAAARPQALTELILSRYEPGMAYGTHVDNAFINGKRTDLSFTLFLNEPDQYEGGALVIDETLGERYVKLPAGSLFLYPSSTLHQVEKVTHGCRLVAVGWIQSYLRRPDQREMLFDLDRAIYNLRSAGNEPDQTLDLLLKTRSNLMRMWSES